MKLQDKIFYNYGNFICENKTLFDKKKYLDVITNPENYNKFISAITQGLDESTVKSIMPIFDRERQVIIEESSNISSSTIASAYAITYFPILADIYSDDVLLKAMVNHITNVPIMTFPKMQLQATVNNSNGTSLTLPFPRARYLIRATPEDILVEQNQLTNIFTLSSSYPNEVNEKLSTINKRYFLADELSISIQDSDSTTLQNIIVGIGIRPDARNQVTTKFEFTDGDYVISGSIVGNINWDTGVFVYSVAFDSSPDMHKYIVNYLKLSVMFTARTGDIGRVKISLLNNGWDVNVDVKEDFEFELTSEMLQEYSDLYNIDVVKFFSEAIKSQVGLNRDHGLVQLLRSAEPEMKKLNAYETINFQTYRDMSNLISPSFIGAVFQTVAPRISVISRYIWVNFRAIPQYIITGVRAAAALEQLQEFAVTLPTYKQGLLGFDNLHAMNIHVNVFLKSVILSCPAMDDDKMYLVYKPDEDDDRTEQNPQLQELSKRDKLRSTVLANIVYKPLYIIEEITNSVKRTFIRSRSTMELFRPEGLGCIHMGGFRDLLTSSTELKTPII